MVCQWQPRVNSKELVKFSAAQNDNHGRPMVTVMQLVSLNSRRGLFAKHDDADTDQETSAIMDAAFGQVPRMCPPAGRLG